MSMAVFSGSPKNGEYVFVFEKQSVQKRDVDRSYLMKYTWHPMCRHVAFFWGVVSLGTGKYSSTCPLIDLSLYDSSM